MAQYFVNPRVSRSSAQSDGIGRYWRGSQTFGGWAQAGETYASIAAAGLAKDGKFHFQINLNLLAELLDGTPIARGVGAQMVAPIDYLIKHREDPAGVAESATVAVSPREEIGGIATLQQQGIGPKLAAFLDDPLGLRATLGLSLPLLDERASLSQSWHRELGVGGDRSTSFHGGFDFSVLEDVGQPRPLFNACAVADGVVWMLLARGKHAGGVVLRHESAGGAIFATLYQHLNADTIALAVGERVRRGQTIGRILRNHPAGKGEKSHLHFDLLVRAPVSAPGLSPSSRLWFAIDPFGVYDEHTRNSPSDYVYVPRGRGGLTYPIHGNSRAVHWAADPPIGAYCAELQTSPRKIRLLQVRHRVAGGGAVRPAEIAQLLVWLDGDPTRYRLRLGKDLDRAIEVAACALLRAAFRHGRPVRLGYRFRNQRREIAAVWVA